MSEWAGVKDINPEQLNHELGHPEMRVVGPDPENGNKTKVWASASQTALDTVVLAHTADKNWTHPDPEPVVISPEEQERIDTLKRMKELETSVLPGSPDLTELMKLTAKATRKGWQE
jgi:hypothetical protein